MAAIERVLLWGFMASGKSAVGTRLAQRLGWEHIDLDREIVRRAGRPIAQIFREEGEPAFRSLEMEVTRELISRPEAVLSPGGGWVTNPGALEQLSSGTLTVWLRVSPEAVLERLRADRDGPERPLLAAPDPAARIRTLLAEREPLYARAAHAVSTDDRSVESIVDEIVALLHPTLPESDSRSKHPDG